MLAYDLYSNEQLPYTQYLENASDSSNRINTVSYYSLRIRSSVTSCGWNGDGRPCPTPIWGHGDNPMRGRGR